MERVEEALRSVGARITAACERSGRDPGGVRIIAVTKQVAPEMVRAAAAAGVSEFGENYVNELEQKRPHAPEATWHFVGRLQSNKVSRVAEAADVIHTIEPGRAVERLTSRASSGKRVPDCLIEVDFTGRRVGVSPEELPELASTVTAAGLPLTGLMTVAPPEQDPRPWFARMRELRDQLRERDDRVRELSMGMSADLEVAVEEGATMVRVGTAIFGPRRR